jgi:hypothetical protein
MSDHYFYPVATLQIDLNHSEQLKTNPAPLHPSVGKDIPDKALPVSANIRWPIYGILWADGKADGLLPCIK